MKLNGLFSFSDDADATLSGTGPTLPTMTLMVETTESVGLDSIFCTVVFFLGTDTDLVKARVFPR